MLKVDKSVVQYTALFALASSSFSSKRILQPNIGTAMKREVVVVDRRRPLPEFKCSTLTIIWFVLCAKWVLCCVLALALPLRLLALAAPLHAAQQWRGSWRYGSCCCALREAHCNRTMYLLSINAYLTKFREWDSGEATPFLSGFFTIIIVALKLDFDNNIQKITFFVCCGHRKWRWESLERSNNPSPACLP